MVQPGQDNGSADDWDVIEPQEFYTLAEVARIVRLKTVRAVRRALRLNQIPVLKMGEQYKVRHRHVLELIEKSTVQLKETKGEKGESHE